MSASDISDRRTVAVSAGHLDILNRDLAIVGQQIQGISSSIREIQDGTPPATGVGMVSERSNKKPKVLGVSGVLDSVSTILRGLKSNVNALKAFSHK